MLYSNNAYTRLIPASNRKLFTATSALRVLGENYRIHTTVLGDAQLSGDTLKGNLYLRGGGDPLLTADDIKTLVSQLTDAGLKHVTGDIVGDATLFTDGPYPAGWSWDYLADDYAPQISSLEVEQDLTSVAIAPGKQIGDKPAISLSPATGYIPIVDEAKTGASDSDLTLSVTRPFNRGEIVVTGNVPLGYKQAKPIAITVDNPALYATTLLAEGLMAAGVTIDGSVRLGVTAHSAATLVDHASAPLKDYLPQMLKPSNNLIAETLVRLIGVERGTGGNYKSGYAVERGVFDKIGISPDQYSFSDGSGVTRLDLVSANAVVTLLNSVAMDRNFRLFYDALPIAGVDGTLAKRMKGTAAEGNAHAKTGTVRYAHALSGYVSDADANIVAFSILNNNFQVDSGVINKFQDALVDRLAREHGVGIISVKPVVKPAPIKWHNIVIIRRAPVAKTAPPAPVHHPNAVPAKAPAVSPAKLAKPSGQLSSPATVPSAPATDSTSAPAAAPPPTIATPTEEPAPKSVQDLPKQSVKSHIETLGDRPIAFTTEAPKASAAAVSTPKKTAPLAPPVLAIPASMKPGAAN